MQATCGPLRLLRDMMGHYVRANLQVAPQAVARVWLTQAGRLLGARALQTLVMTTGIVCVAALHSTEARNRLFLTLTSRITCAPSLGVGEFCYVP